MKFKVCNEGDYNWIEVSLEPIDDSSLVPKIKKKARIVSQKVNPKNLGREIRGDADKYIHCLSGIFAEEVIKAYLKEFGKNADLEIIEEEFNTYDDHVDVKIKINKKEKTIEVRSSLQYKKPIGVHRIINEWTLIGTYIHGSKRQEKIKDFHITVIYQCKPEDFEHNLDVFNVETIIAGGVSRDNLARYGKEVSRELKQEGVRYFGVRPINSAPKDTINLFKEILEI